MSQITRIRTWAASGRLRRRERRNQLARMAVKVDAISAVIVAAYAAEGLPVPEALTAGRTPRGRHLELVD